MREQQDVAQFLPHAVALAFARKEAAQAIFADISFDDRRVSPFACRRERARVKIRGKYLDRWFEIVSARLFENQYRNRISLLAGSAATNPDPQWLRHVVVMEQLRQHQLSEAFIGFAVAEKGGDGDQEIGEERLRLFRLFAENFIVVGNLVSSRDLHAPRDSTQNCRTFVLREVMPGADTQVCQNATKQFFIDLWQIGN